MALSFDQKLRNYAELIVRKDINLRRGQRLHVTCPVEAAALGREEADVIGRRSATAADVLRAGFRDFTRYKLWNMRRFIGTTDNLIKRHLFSLLLFTGLPCVG